MPTPTAAGAAGRRPLTPRAVPARSRATSVRGVTKKPQGGGERPYPLRLLRGVDLLRRHERGWLRRDILAGVTVAAYLVPQVMAYAEVAGLPAVAGLWAIIGSLAAYAVLGSSRQLSVGPESTTALMTAAAVGR